MVEACIHFGAKLYVDKEKIEIEGIHGKIEHLEDVIYAGNSGIVLRFCTALAAVGKYPCVITGDYSIRHQRPMKSLLDGLAQVGVRTTSMRGDDYAPVIVQGPIQPGKIRLRGEDSQPVSALLIAAAFAGGPFEIEVQNPGEKPWVFLTLDWFDRLGIKYKQTADFIFQVEGKSSYEGFSYEVPGDCSSAAFPIAAALITHSEITIHNIDMQDKQGDKRIIELFQEMGGVIHIDHQRKMIEIKRGERLKGIMVDINDCIDAITLFAVVGCFAEGKTHIRNGAIAKQKECNRIHCIAKELRKMGASIFETEDGLLIEESPLFGAKVYSHDDHRMAMSLIIAAMGANGRSEISSVNCIAKTFPSFATEFIKLGATIY
jgi:3-phosphoshikimate 1-carboxyvinyltransferase